MADRAAAFVHITTLIRQSIVCEKYESSSPCVQMSAFVGVRALFVCGWDIESDS